jgi:hypothetical protein
MTSPENIGSQFDSIMSSNYSKCPGCSNNYVTETSPASMVDNTTKICPTCSAGENSRAAIANVDATKLLDNSGSLERLTDSYSVARGTERAVKQAQSDSSFHNSRIRNASVPVPNPSKVGKWDVTYDKNRFTGSIEAHADNGGNSHYARLDHETGQVSFGAYDTATPPKTVQDHITKVLTQHHKTFIKREV